MRSCPLATSVISAARPRIPKGFGRRAVAMIAAQDYPGEGEIVLALGPSSDRTDEVAAVLKHTLDHFNVPAREQGEVLGAFAAHKDEVTAGYRAAHG